MRTHVEFRSDLFPAYPDEEEEVNPGRWGRRLAEFLRRQLAERGLAVGEIYAEDWGWALPIESRPFPVWLGCGNREGHPEDGYLVFIEPCRPFVRRGFRRLDTRPILGPLADAIDEILASTSGIRDVSWRHGPVP